MFLKKIFLDLVNYLKYSKYLNLKCVSVHIGSQILDHKPYERTLNVLEKILIKAKYNFDYIDLGGGMGINYGNNTKKINLKKYSLKIKKFFKKI